MSRTKSLSSLLSRRDPTEDEFDAATDEMHAGSDRTAAIIGSALIENALVKAIRSAIKDDSDTAALFYDESAPFGTFKRRIVGAKALGLITKREADDLDIIRDIRNQFAHALLNVTFENEHLKRRCDKFSDYGMPAVDERSISPERRKYETACWKITLLLMNRCIKNWEERNNPAWGLPRGGIQDLMGLGANALVTARRKSRPNNVLSDVTTDKLGVEDKD